MAHIIGMPVELIVRLGYDLERLFVGPPVDVGTRPVAVDLHVDGSSIVVRAIVPEFQAEEISATLEGGVLSISAHHRTEPTARFRDWAVGPAQPALRRRLFLRRSDYELTNTTFEHPILTLRLERSFRAVAHPAHIWDDTTATGLGARPATLSSVELTAAQPAAQDTANAEALEPALTLSLSQ